jgi:hypothetical protein
MHPLCECSPGRIRSHCSSKLMIAPLQLASSHSWRDFYSSTVSWGLEPATDQDGTKRRLTSMVRHCSGEHLWTRGSVACSKLFRRQSGSEATVWRTLGPMIPTFGRTCPQVCQDRIHWQKRPREGIPSVPIPRSKQNEHEHETTFMHGD